MTAAPVSASFTMVCPGHVADVGPAAAILFARICWRADRGGWRASRAVLAEETGLTLDMIRTACRVLRDRGWVRAERSSADDATLVWTPVLAGQPDMGNSPTSDVGESPRPDGESPHLPDVGESPISSLETVETRETPPTTPPDDAEEQQALPLLSVVASPPASGVDEEFAGFWNAYPRKVAKQAALKAYRAARKVASLEAIAAGLRAQLPDLRTRDSHLIPHAATWLNQHRWEDDPRAAAQPRGGPRNYDLERMQARAAGVTPEITTGATALALQMLEARR